ncbi:hypothetical protein BDZ89DRAFT_1193004 [Hymenopellis radicata]|nr:hypothetical protein BDZ89DRAFT_1193004 [Hymenopellis radicata]
MAPRLPPELWSEICRFVRARRLLWRCSECLQLNPQALRSLRLASRECANRLADRLLFSQVVVDLTTETFGHQEINNKARLGFLRAIDKGETDLGFHVRLVRIDYLDSMFVREQSHIAHQQARHSKLPSLSQFGVRIGSNSRCTSDDISWFQEVLQTVSSRTTIKDLYVSIELQPPNVKIRTADIWTALSNFKDLQVLHLDGTFDNRVLKSLLSQNSRLSRLSVSGRHFSSVFDDIVQDFSKQNSGHPLLRHLKQLTLLLMSPSESDELWVALGQAGVHLANLKLVSEKFKPSLLKYLTAYDGLEELQILEPNTKESGLGTRIWNGVLEEHRDTLRRRTIGESDETVSCALQDVFNFPYLGRLDFKIDPLPSE